MIRSSRTYVKSPLAGTQATLAEIVRSSEDAILAKELDGTVTVWNPAAERLYGYDASEIVGQNVSRLIPSDRPDELPNILRRLARGERIDHYETVRVRKDGKRIDVSVSISPIHDAAGNVTGAAAIARDIAEQRLRQADAAQAQYRELLDMAPDPILITNQAGEIVVLNRQAEQQFGYSREELLGQRIELLIPERFRQRHVGHRTDYQAGPRTRPMGVGLELYARRKNGSEFPVEISLSPSTRPNGELLVTSIIRDVSDRRSYEEKLRQATVRLQHQAAELERSNAELQQFAYIASHDLQEPLRMVASFTQLLSRRYRGRLDPDADEIVGFAVDGAKRMQELINDLLVYSRVGSQERAENVDCQSLVQQIVEDLNATIQESRGQLSFSGLPTVKADPAQLRQVFQNLISNAIKFHGPQPPRVEIKAEPRNGAWLFSVRDNGIGIEPEYADRVFVIFQRLHAASEYPGTGIGLAICKKIVERLGGRIWFESEPGKGTVFFFTIPSQGMEAA